MRVQPQPGSLILTTVLVCLSHYSPELEFEPFVRSRHYGLRPVMGGGHILSGCPGSQIPLLTEYVHIYLGGSATALTLSLGPWPFR